MNGCVPGLALIERLKATRKWAMNRANHSINLEQLCNSTHIIKKELSICQKPVMDWHP